MTQAKKTKDGPKPGPRPGTTGKHAAERRSQRIEVLLTPAEAHAVVAAATARSISTSAITREALASAGIIQLT